MLPAAGIAHGCCRHVPPAGRAAIKAALDDAGVSITTAACTCVLFCAGVNYGWIEVNAQHAFIRDEMSKVGAAVRTAAASSLTSSACRAATIRRLLAAAWPSLWSSFNAPSR